MLDRIAEFFIFGLAPLVVGVLAVPQVTKAGEKTITGEVIYRERIALPPDAVLVIELADVSVAGAPATVIAKRRVAPTGQRADQIRHRFRPQGDPEGPDLCAASAHHGRRAADVHHRHKPPGRSAGRRSSRHRLETGWLTAPR
ncbi:YbaY family lipoprotein [Mesorhizobium atlanticum]